MKPLVLIAVLAPTASAIRVTAGDVVKQHQEVHHKRFGAMLEADIERARRAGQLKEKKDRHLYSNSNFLNYQYYSDGACAAKPWAGGGYGVGACIPLSASSSLRFTGCSGSGASLEIDYRYYSAVADCSGTPAETASYEPTNGQCSDLEAVADDDKVNLDDRFVIFEDDDPFYGLTYGQTYQILTCDAGIKKPTAFWRASFEDSRCDSLVGYFGLNEGGCAPYNMLTDTYYAVMGCSFDIRRLTVESDCRGEDILEDDFVGDDYNTDVDGGCYAHTDDDSFPGNYELASSTCSDDSTDDLCFAGSETVLLESGETRALSEVSVGDRVQVVGADGALKFSEVVFLPHSANTDRATFTELQLASGNTLRATPAHFVLAGACGADAFELTAMKYLSEGSCVQTASGEDEVTGSSLVVDHGVYTLVTKEATGLVVVNGVRASSFALNHWLTNQYYSIHRTVYEWAPSLMKNRDVIAANLIVGDVASTTLSLLFR